MKLTKRVSSAWGAQLHGTRLHGKCSRGRVQQVVLDCREHLERKLAVMERQLLGGQPSTSAPADPDKLAKQQRLLQYHAERVRCAAVPLPGAQHVHQ